MKIYSKKNQSVKILNYILDFSLKHENIFIKFLKMLFLRYVNILRGYINEFL